MAKTVCKILGVVFLLIGVCGFAAPRLVGAHLSNVHNVIHIVSGAIALYLGFAGTLSAAKIVCLVFGLVYLALAVMGIAFGEGADRMWMLGSSLHFGQADHFIHGILGLVFLAGGLFTKRT